MTFKHLLAGFAAIAVVGCSSTPANNDQAAAETAVVADAGETNIPGLYTPAPDQAVIYYKRADNDYTDWGLHLWSGDVVEETSWYDAFPLTGVSDKYGAYYVVPLKSADWKEFKFIVHMGNSKDLGGLDHSYSREKFGVDVFTTEGSAVLKADPEM
ncbi:pullulanase-associated domain-containing protein [Psychromonas sp. MME1]|uniref:pullulanase-associated domain-containing protein n=1 Tax=Psychromonas sp. MME1 TaxID=3231032 RepID=UPI0034E2B876